VFPAEHAISREARPGFNSARALNTYRALWARQGYDVHLYDLRVIASSRHRVQQAQQVLSRGPYGPATRAALIPVVIAPAVTFTGVGELDGWLS
jgi:hypothetical protein